MVHISLIFLHPPLSKIFQRTFCSREQKSGTFSTPSPGDSKVESGIKIDSKLEGELKYLASLFKNPKCFSLITGASL